MPDDSVLRRLLAEDLVALEDGRPRTTRRWQRAMVRAAAALYGDAQPYDLRYPIVHALIDLLGDLDDQELGALVEAMLPIEQAELVPLKSKQAFRYQSTVIYRAGR